MGRMAEARKRARRRAPSGEEAAAPKASKGSQKRTRGGESKTAAGAGRKALPEAPVRQPKPATPPPGMPESLFFPADPEPGAAAAEGRLTLPASGLAEDILALADSARVEVTPAALATTEEAVPVPAAAAPSAVSFFGAPQREERQATEATEHLATFYLCDEEYGVDVRLVQEIIRVTQTTQVPRAPEFIKGVINLRGRIIPVVDLKRKLGLGEVEETSRQARIVVVKVNARLIGLLVDGASQVLRVPVASIEPPPEEVVEINAEYIRGVAKLETRLIILVDLRRILAGELRAATPEGAAEEQGGAP